MAIRQLNIFLQKDCKYYPHGFLDEYLYEV